MKNAALLQQLETQLEQLAHTIKIHINKQTTQLLFDHQLFHSHSARLADYLQEVRQTIAQLKQNVIDNRPSENVAWMAERVVLQIGALQRELITQKMRKIENQTIQIRKNLYEKLAEHRVFEYRLRAMIKERENLLVTQQTPVEQIRLQKELAALERRLLHCLQALQRIERSIKNHEKGL